MDSATDSPAGRRGRDWPVAAVYGVLFIVGVVEGTIGSFQYGRVPTPVPVAALVCCAAILLTCLLAAWAMGSVSGAVLSMPVASGTVIITATTPGKWFLYGGTLSVVAAVIASFAGLAFGPRSRG
jgi:hypothetical protein